jgi:hypothetical protein
VTRALRRRSAREALAREVCPDGDACTVPACQAARQAARAGASWVEVAALAHQRAPRCRVHDRPLTCPVCACAAAGRVSSPAKAAAARANARRPRPRKPAPRP